MTNQEKVAGASASKLISEKIAELSDWRGATLATVRALITEAVFDVLEEVKWRGTPVWSNNGGICTGETYKAVVKLTFFNGAALKHPANLFNSSHDGKVLRAIDIHEGEEIDEKAFKAFTCEATLGANLGRGKLYSPK